MMKFNLTGKNMKRSFIISVLLALLMSACSHEVNEQESISIARSFLIHLDDTKTSYDNNVVQWSEGDVIRYYSAKNGEIGTAQVDLSQSFASINVSIGTGDTFLIAEYGGSTILNNTGKDFILKGAVSDIQDGSFRNAHVAVVKTYEMKDNTTLHFKNITSLIKFSIKRMDVDYIVFKATGGEQLHGDGFLKLSFSDENSTASFEEAGGASIRVNTNGPGTFYISTLPLTLSEGFSIECYDANDRLLGSAKSSKAVTLNQNEILNVGELDSRIEQVFTDLSAQSFANCYVVSQYGDYKFCATVKGPGPDTIDGTPFRAVVLWESLGDGSAAVSGSIVKDILLDDDYVVFSTGGEDGNALIAVKDRDDELLWSWHIWVCKDYDPVGSAQTCPNKAGIIMDRYIGATTNLPGNPNAKGLYYQWGHKDPIAQGVGNAIGVENEPLWGTVKSLSDPCPAGWRIPEGGNSGVWATAFASSTPLNTESWNSSAKGFDFGGFWFPASGIWHIEQSSITGDGKSLAVWSCAEDPEALYVQDNGILCPVSNEKGSSFACSVRCVSETSDPIIAPSEVVLSSSSIFVEPGMSVTIDASVSPSNANVTDLSWSSGDVNVATVSPKGTIIGVSSGECVVTATAYNGVSSSVKVTVAKKDAAANCHIVSPDGWLAFPAVKGNSSTSVGTITRVAVLWETFGTNVKPSVGDVVQSAYKVGDHIIVHAGAASGNAVVCAKDAAGTILWSWHVWVTPEDLAALAQVYKNDAGTMMDRNLGALAADPTDVRSRGLLYQWGRKDPFRGNTGTNNGERAVTTNSWPSAVKSSKTTGTVTYTIQHPMEHIYGISTDYSWVWGDSYGLWLKKKTIYDPCPPGWRVPDGGDKGIWAKAHGQEIFIAPNQFRSDSNALYFDDLTVNGSETCYPRAGYVDKESNQIYSGFRYWSCTTSSVSTAYSMSIYMNVDVSTSIKQYEASACAVRCMAE